MSVQRKTLAWTATGVIIGAVMLAWTVHASLGSTPDAHNQTGTGNQQGDNNQMNPSVGAGGCVAINGTCIAGKTDDWQAMRDEVGSDNDPTGPAPWTFIVLGTGNQKGQYLRDGYTEKDHRLPGEPLVLEGQAVYVDCRIDDGWAADPSSSGGKRWYKIRYPEVSTPGDFWAYSGYLYPVRQNGNVPVCETS